MMKSLCSANNIVNFVSRHAAFYRIMLSPFGRNAHDCLVYFDVSWRDIFSVELKKIAWSSYNLSLTSDKMLLAVGGDQFLSHHELRPSVGPVLNPYPHNSVCVCVYRHKAEVSAYACAYACVVSSLCPIILVRWPHCASRPQHWPSRLNRPIQGGKSVDQ